MKVEIMSANEIESRQNKEQEVKEIPQQKMADVKRFLDDEKKRLTEYKVAQDKEKKAFIEEQTKQAAIAKEMIEGLEMGIPTISTIPTSSETENKTNGEITETKHTTVPTNFGDVESKEKESSISTKPQVENIEQNPDACYLPEWERRSIEKNSLHNIKKMVEKGIISPCGEKFAKEYFVEHGVPYD
jgi:hypothetical protein